MAYVVYKDIDAKVTITPPVHDYNATGVSELMTIKMKKYGYITVKDSVYSLKVEDSNTVVLTIFDTLDVEHTYTFNTGVNIPLNKVTDIGFSWTAGSAKLYIDGDLIETKVATTSIKINTELIDVYSLNDDSILQLYKMILTNDIITDAEFTALFGTQQWMTSYLDNVMCWIDYSSVVSETQWNNLVGTATIALTSCALVQDTIYNKSIEAFIFNGTTNGINVSVGSLDSYTVQCNVYIDYTDSRDIWKDTTSPYGGRLLFKGTGIEFDDGLSDIGNLEDLAVTPYKWNNITCQYDKESQDMYLYTNGELKASASSITLPALDGLSFAPTSSLFKGFVANILIYNRVLSQSEVIHNYYNTDSPIKIGLVGWYEPSGIVGSELKDKSGEYNHGTVI